MALCSQAPRLKKLFSCSTQLSMNFFLLINVKMPTIVGILTFMSRKNSILGLSESEKSWISWYFYTYYHLKFHAQLSWAWKKFYNLGPWLNVGYIVTSFTLFRSQEKNCVEMLFCWYKIFSRVWIQTNVNIRNELNFFMFIEVYMNPFGVRLFCTRPNEVYTSVDRKKRNLFLKSVNCNHKIL